MNNKEYAEAANHTDVQSYQPVYDRLNANLRVVMILHALMGITTEAGELMDELKKHLIYGKPLDYLNLIEEDGDLRWYLALLELACDSNADDVQARNIAKLKIRFPNKFTELDALNRNLKEERKVLVEPRTGAGSLD